MSRPNAQAPEIERFDDDIHRDSVERHPAYGHIYAGRVSGQMNLYGSDFSHQHYITISISRSEVKRNLSNDWHHSGEELIEVALSEAQWATFVSSLNAMGTQCTLTHFERKMVPGIERKTDRREQFAGEVEKLMAKADKKLKDLEEEIAGLKLSQKQRDALSAKVSNARDSYQAGMPFITDQFDEHMETTVERAKVEVNAYATQLLQRTGLAALQGGIRVPVTLALDGDIVMQEDAHIEQHPTDCECEKHRG